MLSITQTQNQIFCRPINKVASASIIIIFRRSINVSYQPKLQIQSTIRSSYIYVSQKLLSDLTLERGTESFNFRSEIFRSTSHVNCLYNIFYYLFSNSKLFSSNRDLINDFIFSLLLYQYHARENIQGWSLGQATP